MNLKLQQMTLMIWLLNMARIFWDLIKKTWKKVWGSLEFLFYHKFGSKFLYNNLNELPQWNWIQATEKHDYRALARIDLFSDSIYLLHLDKLNSEFIDTFGISDNYKRYLNLLIELECLKIDYFIDEERSILTFIKLKEIEIEKLQSEFKTAESKIDVNVYVTKFMQTYIDRKKVSVIEYYSMIKAMEKEYKNGKQN